MFGLSFGEVCLLIIVAIVVIGPKDMPKMLRKAGQFAGKMRKLATDVRAQSGIDEVLREGSLHEDFNEIRRLAQADFLSPIARPAPLGSGSVVASEVGVLREREYPREGCDAYNATPDMAALYAHQAQPSAWARDPLYVLGDASAPLPAPETASAPPPPPPVETSLHEVSEAPDRSPPAPPVSSVAPQTPEAAS